MTEICLLPGQVEVGDTFDSLEDWKRFHQIRRLRVLKIEAPNRGRFKRGDLYAYCKVTKKGVLEFYSGTKVWVKLTRLVGRDYAYLEDASKEYKRYLDLGKDTGRQHG